MDGNMASLSLVTKTLSKQARMEEKGDYTFAGSQLDQLRVNRAHNGWCLHFDQGPKRKH